MIKASTPELLLHFAVLESGNNSFNELTTVYSEHLLSCLNTWYGSALYDDPSLAYEAVYQSLRHYSEHPRKYNPEQGCLVRFLELNADKAMQDIFEREKYPLTHSLERYLARYFDNERDFLMAKLIMKKENLVPALVELLDIGSYRIAQQLSEINRHTQRIQKILDAGKAKTVKAKKRRTKRKSQMVTAI